MHTLRSGRTATFLFVTLALICIATSGYLTHSIVSPARTLRIRIVSDPSNLPFPGASIETLKARVESVSEVFQRAAGIRLVVAGVSTVRLLPQTSNPELLRKFIDLKIPREDADILISFRRASSGDAGLGAALPYSPTAVVRMDGDTNSEADRAILAHQILTLFGVPASYDAKSVMHVPPVGLQLDAASDRELNEVRLFDFQRGLAGMSRRMQRHVLNALTEQAKSNLDKSPGGSARVMLADLYTRDGQLPAAIEQYRALIRMDAKQLLAHLALARALSQNAQPAEAEREARIAVELSPAQADAHYELGYALVRGGNPEGAIQEFRKSVEMEPGSVRNRTGLAVAYAASIGEFDAADRTFQEALQLDPRNAALLGDIQFVKQLRARLSRQLEAAQTMVRLHPESGPAHDSEALLLLRLGIRERAITEVREALKLSPGTWSPHYTLALALYANHDYVGSRAALADAQKLGAGVKPFLEQSLHTAEARQLTK